MEERLLKIENQIKGIEGRLSSYEKLDKFLLYKAIQISDGKNIQLGKTTGTKIGTETAQKLGFWNVTPVIQPANAAQAAVSGTADSTYSANEVTLINDIVTLVNALRTALVNTGIIKGSA